LQGEEIPLAGRIVAVADVFDALTSRRSYKEAYTVEDALLIIRQGRNSHFDPLIIDAFEAGLEEIMEIYEQHKEL
jgi:HD-GYP domain-containing protein (c-di-GMP phosphodiesterase class II)